MKDYRVRQFHTLFGRLRLKIPRLVDAEGHLVSRQLFDVPGYARTTPEFDGVRARLAAWMSYRHAQDLLAMLMPTDGGMSLGALHANAQTEGNRLLGTRVSPDIRPASRGSLAIDTTFVRSCEPERGRHHEILVGAAEADAGPRRYFGVPLKDHENSVWITRRVLAEVGVGRETGLTAFTDGAGAMRQLAARIGADGLPILDWHHIAMRLQPIRQAAAALGTRVPSQVKAKKAICKAVESIRWSLWHGKANAVRKAANRTRDALRRYRYEAKPLYQPAPSRKVWSGLQELEKYVRGQDSYTVNYAKRKRQGDWVGTSLPESMAEALVNRRMNKDQHMRWSRKGALHLLQIRAADLNGDLEDLRAFA